MYLVLRSTGVFFPEKVCKTSDLMSHEHPQLLLKRRLLSVLGCETVHQCGPEDTPATMAAEAACSALESAEWGSDDVQLLMTVGCTLPDLDIWSTSAKVAQLLDVMSAECMGVGDVACAGSFTALRVLRAILSTERELSRAVLCAGCAMPGGRIFIPATVFGDGAGAFVLEKVAKPKRGELFLKDVAVHSHPEFIDAFGPQAGFRRLQKKGVLLPEDWTFEVRDQLSYAELAKVNFDLGAELLSSRLKKLRWKPSQVTRFLGDNVTKSVGAAIAERIQIPLERVDAEGCRVRGHAFAADMFANLHFSLQKQPLEPGERIVSMGMGLGQHWGTAFWQCAK